MATSASPTGSGPPSLLGVFAHPDDESLLAGGVLAQQAASGARTAVVTTTWAQGTTRAAELAAALAILGAGEPRLLGHGDARNPSAAPGRARWCEVNLDDAVAQIVAHIRQFRPDIVVTHDALGQLTGHPDHRRTHQVVLLAVEAARIGRLHPEAGQPWRTSALYGATHPPSGIGALGTLLTGAGKALLSVQDEDVTATVDVTPWLTQKWAAIRSHTSQLKGDRPLPALLARLDAATRSRILATEYFTRIGALPTPAVTHMLTP
ncbi:PIG-L deacetylase family protein [Streptomyces fructofermentans]|uniref:PIG-L deacetylase family protein n=1 Tax=Streptomyces fructofermentans TaxID=152141 RepID=UPI0037977E22